jgi:5-methylcytosine-specific restriction endonuclease McrA
MSSHQALVLNADYRPLNLFPLSLWSWQDAVAAVFLDRVTVVSSYERTVRSERVAMRLPSVIALRNYVPVQRHPPLTRYNIYLRDGFTCQYCRVGFHARDLTFDHVVPRCRGGLTTWENIATACSDCNRRKGAMSLERCGLTLVRKPSRPSAADLLRLETRAPHASLHRDWIDFVYWDSALEP